MFHSEQSPINPRTGVKWAHGDAIRCICGAQVRVGLGGFGNLRLHQRGARHGLALRLRIETAVDALNRQAVSETAARNGGEPSPGGAQLPHRRLVPGPSSVATPQRTQTPQSSATHIIRQLRRAIHGMPDEFKAALSSAPSDGPLAALAEGSGASDSPWEVSAVELTLSRLFGPDVSQETIEGYVQVGSLGLDALATWLRKHVYKRVEDHHLRPLQRMLDAIRLVARRRGFSLPADEDEASPAPASSAHPTVPVAPPQHAVSVAPPPVAPVRRIVPPHTPAGMLLAAHSGRHPILVPMLPQASGPIPGPSRLPIQPNPASGPPPPAPLPSATNDTSARPREAVCPLCGPECGRLKTSTEQVTHMSAHILFDRRVPPGSCAFCLQPPVMGCRFHLRKDRQQIDYALSYCRLMPAHLSYGPASRSIPSSPCSNVPKVCPLCPANAPAVWKYHLQRHIVEVHRVAPDPFGYLFYLSADELRGMRGVLEKAFIRVRRHINEIADFASTVPGPPRPTDVRTPSPPRKLPIPALSSPTKVKSEPVAGPVPTPYPHSGPSTYPPPATLTYIPAPVVPSQGDPDVSMDDAISPLAEELPPLSPIASIGGDHSPLEAGVATLSLVPSSGLQDEPDLQDDELPASEDLRSSPGVAHTPTAAVFPLPTPVSSPEVDKTHLGQKRMRDDEVIETSADDVQSKRPRTTL
ncbi:hypothetical protein EXIGLDRAFT_725617 [Exidia glandulosa HHB12029]|uniref:Uncharacterized protein n=1 Tax=Exidia glandulosa HHB12029 TaxID=1314781 RepID=A0A165Q678_EXIGL|nr:hypothetical protein EXIGLDRAFT_725617 [Exidia glandulosa HHB12029]